MRCGCGAQATEGSEKYPLCKKCGKEIKIKDSMKDKGLRNAGWSMLGYFVLYAVLLSAIIILVFYAFKHPIGDVWDGKGWSTLSFVEKQKVCDSKGMVYIEAYDDCFECNGFHNVSVDAIDKLSGERLEDFVLVVTRKDGDEDLIVFEGRVSSLVVVSLEVGQFYSFYGWKDGEYNLNMFSLLDAGSCSPANLNLTLELERLGKVDGLKMVKSIPRSGVGQINVSFYVKGSFRSVQACFGKLSKSLNVSVDGGTTIRESPKRLQYDGVGSCVDLDRSFNDEQGLVVINVVSDGYNGENLVFYLVDRVRYYDSYYKRFKFSTQDNDDLSDIGSEDVRVRV